MTKSLFEQLGGREGIVNIVDDTIDTHLINPAVSARFLPFMERPEYLAIIKSHTVDFFSAGSGGPVQYTGKDMVTAHAGMNISAGEYMHVVDDIFIALDKNNISDSAKKEVLYILWSLKGMIVAQ